MSDRRRADGLAWAWSDKGERLLRNPRQLLRVLISLPGSPRTTNCGLVSNLASVKISELSRPYVCAELHVI